MEEYPSVPKQQSPAPNGTGKNKLGRLAFLEVGRTKVILDFYLRIAKIQL